MKTFLVCVVSVLMSCSPGVCDNIVLVSGYNEAFNIFNISGEYNTLVDFFYLMKKVACSDEGHVLQLISNISVPDSLSWLDVSRTESGDYEIFGIHENTGHVSRMTLSTDLSRVTVDQTVKLPGGGPAHVLVDRDHGAVYVAHYGDGSWSHLELTGDSMIGEVVRHLQFPVSGLQCTSHAHQTVARGGWVWIVDLGCDAVYTVRGDQESGGDNAVTGVTMTPQGCGPRHIALHPSQDIAALVCELKSLVIIYRSVACKYFLISQMKYFLGST